MPNINKTQPAQKKQNNQVSDEKHMVMFCVKCQKKTHTTSWDTTTTSNNRTVLKGTCEKCGTGMTKIVGVAHQ